jgi:hypothetical protein
VTVEAVETPGSHAHATQPIDGPLQDRTVGEDISALRPSAVDLHLRVDSPSAGPSIAASSSAPESGRRSRHLREGDKGFSSSSTLAANARGSSLGGATGRRKTTPRFRRTRSRLDLPLLAPKCDTGPEGRLAETAVRLRLSRPARTCTSGARKHQRATRREADARRSLSAVGAARRGPAAVEAPRDTLGWRTHSTMAANSRWW